ncbi:MAG: hypothetical protein Q8S20_13460 [Sulfuritalea sp.]|nr:hypothetical protein [Sulfuritalea sp.]
MISNPLRKETIERCILSYVQFAQLGMTMTTVFRIAMAEEFGSTWVLMNASNAMYAHPNGGSFSNLHDIYVTQEGRT